MKILNVTKICFPTVQNDICGRKLRLVWHVADRWHVPVWQMQTVTEQEIQTLLIVFSNNWCTHTEINTNGTLEVLHIALKPTRCKLVLVKEMCAGYLRTPNCLVYVCMSRLLVFGERTKVKLSENLIFKTDMKKYKSLNNEANVTKMLRPNRYIKWFSQNLRYWLTNMYQHK